MKIEDYLPFYLGCECWAFHSSFDGCRKLVTLDAVILGLVLEGSMTVKPILRKLSSMTDEEAKRFKVTKGIERNLKTLGGSIWTFDEVKELLSLHFDLFGLIDAGLALDKTTLTDATRK